VVRIKDKMGFLPISVWNLGKSRFFKHLLIKDVIFDQYKYDKEIDIEEKTRRVGGGLFEKKITGRIQRLYGNEPRTKPYKFSEFNPVVAERIIRYWSEEGDTVLNPFSSRAIIPMVAVSLNRNGIAYEIVPSYYEAIQRIVEKFIRQRRLDVGEPWIKLYLGDARNMKEIEDESIQLILTSPPYACKEVASGEFYESVKGQLTDIKTYDEFLEAFRDSIKECYRVLEHGKFCVWVVADVRGHGKLYPLHADTIRIFQEEGFVPHDIIINVLRTPFRLAVGKRVEKKIVQKTHEYILVMKRPEED